MIGTGGTTRLEPGANSPGLYESTDGGATFTEVWDGASRGNSFGVTNVALDPSNASIVYVAAFDAGPVAPLAGARRLRDAVRLPPAVRAAVAGVPDTDVVRADGQERTRRAST